MTAAQKKLRELKGRQSKDRQRIIELGACGLVDG